jgi:hypothetical protein
MFLINTLDSYLESTEDISKIDRDIDFKIRLLKKNRHSWEVFDKKGIESEILELEKKREEAIPSAIDALIELITPFSENYYVISRSGPQSKTIQIHRSNCIKIESLKNGQFDSCSSFDDAKKKSNKLVPEIERDYLDDCEDCLPYLDIVSLKKEIEEYFKNKK